jgi:hypothetical protein
MRSDISQKPKTHNSMNRWYIHLNVYTIANTPASLLPQLNMPLLPTRHRSLRIRWLALRPQILLTTISRTSDRLCLLDR